MYVSIFYRQRALLLHRLALPVKTTLLDENSEENCFLPDYNQYKTPSGVIFVFYIDKVNLSML